MMMSIRARRRAERGVALISAIVVGVVLLGLQMIYTFVSMGGYESSSRDVARTRARLTAEESVHLALAELKTDQDTANDGLGNVSFKGTDDRVGEATATDLGGGLFRIHGRGDVERATMATEVLAIIEEPPPLNFPVRAAVTAEGPVTTTGNINIDGRDWDYSGAFIVGPGSYGVSSMQTIGVNGSSSVGGNGQPPTGSPGPGIIEQNASWSNGIDDDGDGNVDEEVYDGLDDDGDGAVDEDTNGYPQNPDAVFGLAPGTLLNAAQNAGTYFTSQADLNAYIAGHGGNLPGGRIFFLAFDHWEPADLGGGMNDPPSVIIQHNPAGSALMKNIHGEFRGLVIADFVEHINGDFVLLGALMSLADEAYGNAFGNGNANVLYSSTVLAQLPSGNGLKTARVLSWAKANNSGQ